MTTPTPHSAEARLDAAGDLVGFMILVVTVVVAGQAILAVLRVASSTTAGLVSAPAVVFLLLAGTTGLLRRRGLGWREMGLVWDRSPARLLWETLLVVAAVYFALAVLAPMVRAGAGMPEMGIFEALRGDWKRFLLALLVAWAAAAFGEEMLFRGFVMNRLAWVLGGGRAAWIAAALLQGAVFGAGHAYQGSAGMLLTGLMGVVLGFAVLAAGRRLAAAILAHGTIDTISLTQIFLAG